MITSANTVDSDEAAVSSGSTLFAIFILSFGSTLFAILILSFEWLVDLEFNGPVESVSLFNHTFPEQA